MSQKHGFKRGLSTYCPACGSDLHFRKLPRRGNTVTCRQCQSLLEVKRLAPLTLEWAFEEPFDDEDLLAGNNGNQNRQGLEDFALESVGTDEDWGEDWDDDWADDQRED